MTGQRKCCPPESASGREGFHRSSSLRPLSATLSAAEPMGQDPLPAKRSRNPMCRHHRGHRGPVAARRRHRAIRGRTAGHRDTAPWSPRRHWTVCLGGETRARAPGPASQALQLVHPGPRACRREPGSRAPESEPGRVHPRAQPLHRPPGPARTRSYRAFPKVGAGQACVVVGQASASTQSAVATSISPVRTFAASDSGSGGSSSQPLTCSSV